MVHKRIWLVIGVLAAAALACGLVTGGDGLRPAGGSRAAGGEAPAGAAVSGERLFDELGCKGCHEMAPESIAPRLAGIVGGQVALEGDEQVTVDDAYLRRSILAPNEQIVAGYQPVMPDLSGDIDEAELAALVDYIRSLSE